MSNSGKDIIWHCRRMGGSDQVTLPTLNELRHLRELDPKLWGALSCPATGIEFDKRTLELLDTDHDGRIRMPEVLDAVEWLCARINDDADITDSPAALPLSAIATDTDEGKRLAVTCRTILANLGRPDADSINQDEIEEALAKAAHRFFNGDGILPPLPEMEDDIRAFVKAGLDIVGGARDAGGEAGLSAALAEALVKELETWRTWRASVNAAPHPVENTPEAWTLLEEIRAKVDDYFLRCQLAAFAPQTSLPLNAEERLLAASGMTNIDRDTLVDLPLARILPDADLPLKDGLNPLWRERILRFAELIRPLLPDAGAMSHAVWKTVQEALAPYGDALAQRPAATVCAEGAFAPPADPVAAIDALGEDSVTQILESDIPKRFLALCEKDLASASAAEDIAELERLVLYYRHIHRLLMNFVSFHDFYSLRPDVIFRAGTLYIDGRSCQLCVPVEDIKSHSALAALSQLCLLYCECVRRVEDGTTPETRTIMAALTAGGDDVLTEGRNGVFVDNTGADWDATLVKIIHNPISFRQAIWAPYKRAAQLVGEQIAKFANAKRAEALNAAKTTADAVVAPKQQPGAPFDMGRNVGIFAAVGIALGAIGTAIGSIAQALLSLAWWQFPLLILGIFLIVSGSSFFLAWLKFRKRTLGPVLDASGWAVNTQLPINIKLGTALTGIATQPPNIERQSMLDPFREKQGANPWPAIVILIAAIALGAWLWGSGRMESFVKNHLQTPQQSETLSDKKAEKTGAAKKAPEAPAKNDAEKKQDAKK